MKQEQWRKFKQIYQSALDREPSQRDEFLKEICAGDETLRKAVDSLLAFHREAGELSESLMIELADKALAHHQMKAAPIDLTGPTLTQDHAVEKMSAGGRGIACGTEDTKPDLPHSVHSARAPWWMFVVAALFAGLHAFIPYLVIWGPADPEGLNASFERGGMMIRTVAPNTPFMEAGLQNGDRVLAVSGHPIRNTRDWASVQANWDVGQPEVWRIDRGGKKLAFEMIPKRATWQNRLAHSYIFYVGLVLSTFMLGLFIAFRRPGDLVAGIGAWFIVTSSVVFGLPSGWAVLWRQVPLAAQVLLWIPEISRFVIEGIFLSFFAIFPCRLFRARWPWVVIWGPVLATLPWRISEFYSVIYRRGQASPVPGWLSQVTLLRTIVYLAAAIVMLVIAYYRLASLNERRRIRVLIVGTAISLLAAIPVVWIINFFGYGLKPWFALLVGVIFPAILACPLAFAYAILRHRVLDIQVIIRQGLQYAFARGAVLGVVPAMGAILIFDLALNSQEPLAHILRSRGWVYAVFGGLAFVAYWQRRPWLEALDRRFFREHYNAQRLLCDVVEEIGVAKSFERVLPHVVARIESALHPEFVSLMVYETGEKSYRTMASAPAGQVPEPLAANSKIVALAHLLGKPLEILSADSDWLNLRLPQEEIDSLRRARIDLLVPIARSAGSPEVLMALGIKRSEEPYTREDQELLEAIATGLALLFEQTSVEIEHSTGTFEECPQCGTCFDSGTGSCTLDGAALTPVLLSRTLAGRYYLERRRGRGGMGIVYEATDRSLKRRVAVKVIREDWLHSAEAEQRFQREAHAAAAFAHPNVVIVHDFGIEAGTRAFLVMELLQGIALRDELKSHKRLPAARIVEIFRGVCSAVDAAHRQHLIHRDLKPENIFLAQMGDTGTATVKVLDFGIAKFLPSTDDAAETQTGTETRSGVLVGTLGYMSPEQLFGERPATSWDLWALAVVAYEILTGALPFPVHDRTNWQQSVLAGSYTPLSEHLKDPPNSWREFFARALAADPERRPHSAVEFFQLLEQALV
jgi:eukaryotic-like serine/threonine-protein kinase